MFYKKIICMKSTACERPTEFDIDSICIIGVYCDRWCQMEWNPWNPLQALLLSHGKWLAVLYEWLEEQLALLCAGWPRCLTREAWTSAQYPAWMEGELAELGANYDPPNLFSEVMTDQILYIIQAQLQKNCCVPMQDIWGFITSSISMKDLH